MKSIIQLPSDLTVRMRLFCSQIERLPWSKRYQEIKWEAGRLHEETLVAGHPRWKAVQVHDWFQDSAKQRLAAMDAARKQQAPAAPITHLQRKSA